ncbi:hypothetical protein GCM10027168_10890 [Streptomyces capparidis]
MAGKTAWSLAAAVGAHPEPIRLDSRPVRDLLLDGFDYWEGQDRFLRPGAAPARPEQAGVTELMSARARALRG